VKEPKLKLVVLGANGRTGKLVIETALEKGVDVTAVVRSANKKLSRSHNRLAYAIGDPCDPRFLTGIMHNQDVVISTLGGRLPQRSTSISRLALAHFLLDAVNRADAHCQTFGVSKLE
jgi:putative NADH-flavin reductase